MGSVTKLASDGSHSVKIVEEYVFLVVITSPESISHRQFVMHASDLGVFHLALQGDSWGDTYQSAQIIPFLTIPSFFRGPPIPL